MERNELLRRISTFPLAASELANDLLAGDFQSVFRGEGIEFDEVRRYEQGDDMRSVDRNVSARYGTLFVKLYREERELTVFILLDCSASMFAGCGAQNVVTRGDQAILAAALIAFSAERSGQRFGGILFDCEVRAIFKPQKRRSHVMAFTSAALKAIPKTRGTNLKDALSSAGRLLKRRGIVVVISDFLSMGWEQEFGRLAKKHDCIACRINDPLDSNIPNVGLVPIEDPETGTLIWADTASHTFCTDWPEWNAERAALWASICRRSGATPLELSTDDDVVRVVRNFFNKRKRY